MVGRLHGSRHLLLGPLRDSSSELEYRVMLVCPNRTSSVPGVVIGVGDRVLGHGSFIKTA